MKVQCAMGTSSLIRVYLSGPVTGGSKDSIETWRHVIARQLSRFAQVVDPASYKYDATLAFAKRESDHEAISRLQHGHHVVDRNKALIGSCDVLLANFLEGVERASIGSVGEIFLAFAMEKPIVIVRQAHGNVHDHAMLNAVASKVCHSLDDALSVIAELAGVKAGQKKHAT
jgi:nucleoside 2-deoxyribosyltransferase